MYTNGCEHSIGGQLRRVLNHVESIFDVLVFATVRVLKNAASINSIRLQVAISILDLLGPRQIRLLSQVAMRSKGHSSWSSIVPRIFTLLPSL